MAVRQAVAEDVLDRRDGISQPELGTAGIGLGGVRRSAAVEEEIAVGMYAAAEVKIGAGEEAKICFRVNAELEEWDADSLRSPNQLCFATGFSACPDSLGIAGLPP